MAELVTAKPRTGRVQGGLFTEGPLSLDLPAVGNRAQMVLSASFCPGTANAFGVQGVVRGGGRGA